MSFLVCDDPQAPGPADTPEKREALLKWYTENIPLRPHVIMMGSDHFKGPDESSQIDLIINGHSFRKFALSPPKSIKKRYQWIASHGDRLAPYTSDESILFGPVLTEHITDFTETVVEAFGTRVKYAHVEILLSEGCCKGVNLNIDHPFFPQRLYFKLPPMSARELVRVVWTAITEAQARPNVDPVALAREISSRYGTREAPQACK